MSLELEASDEPNRGCIQLYHSTASQVDLKGEKVLRGRWRPWGRRLIYQTLLGAGLLHGTGPEPDLYRVLPKKTPAARPDFVQGDAQDLPFPDESFDAVVNVESANYYPDQARFFNEVARVLRPGGHFLYTDCQPPAGVAVWEATLAKAPLRKLSQRDINAEVMLGMEKHSEHWLDVVDRHAPSFMRSTLREGLPVPGGRHYQGLQDGTTT